MKIDANGTEIRVMGDVVNEDAYISLTDIAKYKNPDNAFIVVANWMRNHSTISFLGLLQFAPAGGRKCVSQRPFCGAKRPPIFD